MKKYLLLAFFMPLLAQAQKIVENKIDDFTHDSVRATSWDPLVWNFGPNMKIRTRVSAVGENLFLSVALMRPGPDMEMADGYWEHDVKNKLAEKLQKQIGLVQ